MSTQVAELSETLPKTIDKARNQLEASALGDKIIKKATSEETSQKLQQFAGGGRSTFGVFGDPAILICEKL